MSGGLLAWKKQKYGETKWGTLQLPASLTSFPVMYTKCLHFSAGGPAIDEAVEAINYLTVTFYI